MKIGNTECKYCNKAYLNCYHTCPKSPARSDDVALNTIFTVVEKAVSDMARYIDEKDVYALVEPTGAARVHCSQIDELPRADVVPKSEVEELEAECERQYEQAKADILANMADGGTSCHWCIDGHKAQAKAEAAREIFAEIDKTIFADMDFFKELKKKYTEEKK